MVSAVVAHMKARYPKATVGEIRRALYETAYNPDEPGSWTKEYGFGIIQPLAADPPAREGVPVLNPRMVAGISAHQVVKHPLN